jgi:hypothetical protein
MRFVALILLLCVGCSHVVTPRIEPSRLPGVYANGDGFWPRWLELKEDRTFSYTQMTDVIEMVSADQFVTKGGWTLSGQWTFFPPDRIEMTTSGSPPKISVFVRPSAKHELAILEPDLFSDILRRWKDDGSLRYLKKKPNQALEPTRGAVTPHAP